MFGNFLLLQDLAVRGLRVTKIHQLIQQLVDDDKVVPDALLLQLFEVLREDLRNKQITQTVLPSVPHMTHCQHHVSSSKVQLRLKSCMGFSVIITSTIHQYYSFWMYAVIHLHFEI